jgi:hypothetical protein
VVLAYRSAAMNIYELPAPRPYFEDPQARCAAQPLGRTAVRLSCSAASVLVRRELFFPGWNARVNGVETPISAHDQIFQSVSVPAGVSEVRFRYAPPHIGWAWLACFIGIAALAIPRSLLSRKHQ